MNLKKLLIIILITNGLFSQNMVWETEFDFIKSNSSPRSVDLNGDGIEDIVLSGGVDGVPSPFGAMAISGANGEVLWAKENGNEWFLSAQYFDQNGDQIPDLIFGGRDAEFELIDGSNGNLIWEFWESEENPNDYGWYNFYTSQFIKDQSGDGLPDILTANGGDHSLDDSELNRPPGHIMIINGMTGEAIKTAVVPDSNETYMSPLICDLNGDSNKQIIFGTGGETINGNLEFLVDPSGINYYYGDVKFKIMNSSFDKLSESEGDKKRRQMWRKLFWLNFSIKITFIYFEKIIYIPYFC